MKKFVEQIPIKFGGLYCT